MKPVKSYRKTSLIAGLGSVCVTLVVIAAVETRLPDRTKGTKSPVEEIKRASNASHHGVEFEGLNASSSPYSERPSRAELMEDALLGGYTSEDLQEAVDDYFSAKELPAPNAELVATIRGFFSPNDNVAVSKVDAGVARVLFDNSIPRGEKIAAFWQAYLQERDTEARGSYLLDNLAGLKPIELATRIPDAFEDCKNLACQKSMVRLAIAAEEIMTGSNGRVPAEDRSFVSSRSASIRNWVREKFEAELHTGQSQEMLYEFAGHFANLYGEKDGRQVLAQAIDRDENTKKALVVPYVSVLLGVNGPDIPELKRVLNQKVLNSPDEEMKREVFDTIRSFAETVPLSSDTKQALLELAPEVPREEVHELERGAEREWADAVQETLEQEKQR